MKVRRDPHLFLFLCIIVSMHIRRKLITIFILMILIAILSVVAIRMNALPRLASFACESKNSTEVYLAVDEYYFLPSEHYASENIFVAEVKNSIIYGKSAGVTSVSDGCDTYTVHVSDLYTVETIDMDKPYLPCNRYTKKEADSLDEALAYLINQAGYETRAGALEAARFMTLRFPYKLEYFYESGRLTGDNYHVDGEGRYYHKGLYLSESKYDEIMVSLEGPEIWGCELYETDTGKMTANGFDCSGFISWALLNGGFDCGDLGAGPVGGVEDLTDLGQLEYVWNVDFDKVKAGDLVGFDGHIGMIIGIEGDHLYIAEAYWVKDLQVRIFEIEEFVNSSPWMYVILMDDYYQEDGDYQAMW